MVQPDEAVWELDSTSVDVAAALRVGGPDVVHMIYSSSLLTWLCCLLLQHLYFNFCSFYFIAASVPRSWWRKHLTWRQLSRHLPLCRQASSSLRPSDAGNTLSGSGSAAAG